MLSKIIKILLLVLVIALVTYIIVFNSSSVDVSVPPDLQIKNINLGVVLISSFIIGAIFASLIAAYFSLISLFRQKRTESDVKAREKFITTLLEARTASAAHQWIKSKALWQSLAKKDPSKVLAKIETAKCLDAEGKNAEALKLIDEARAEAPGNIEVLFRAADLNLKVGNKTAALDNLNLINAADNIPRALKLSRDLAFDLKRYDEALKHNEKALAVGSVSDYEEFQCRALFYKLKNSFKAEQPESLSEYTKELRKFVKKHSHSHLPLIELAHIEEKAGNYESAAELLFKASLITGSSEYWHKSVKIWIDNSLPDRAIAAAKSAAKTTKGNARIDAEFDLIRVTLLLGKFDEAAGLLENISYLVKSLECELTPEQSDQLNILKAYGFIRNNQSDRAKRLIARLALKDLTPKELKDETPPDPSKTGNPPAARLSTP